MRHHLGTGVLGWSKDERQTDRYGCVLLFDRPDGDKIISINADHLVGKRGSLIAIVRDVHPSHTRNKYTGFTDPKVGEEITLGSGTLFEEGDAVGLTPPNPMKDKWLSYKALMRTYNCTVALYFAHR